MTRRRLPWMLAGFAVAGVAGIVLFLHSLDSFQLARWVEIMTVVIGLFAIVLPLIVPYLPSAQAPRPSTVSAQLKAIELNPRFVEHQHNNLVLPVYGWMHESLLEVGEPTSWLVIDDSVRLYRVRDRQAWQAGIHVDILNEPLSAEVSALVPEAVEHLITEARLDDQTAAYLRRRPMPDAKQKYWAKVSLRRIHFDDDHIPDSRLRLDVCPMSFWVEQEVNRRMVLKRAEDRNLDILFHRGLSSILGNGRHLDGYEILSPNTLYAEVSVLTADAFMLVMSKPEDTGGTFAMAGRPWTCGVERSLNWAQCHPSTGQLDPRQTVLDALRDELHLGTTDVAHVEWCAIALEGHLNTALLGIARLTRTRHDLSGREFPRVERVEFVNLDDVPRRVFGRDRDGVWHTTARMRALTTLYRELGSEHVVNQSIGDVRAGRVAAAA